MKDIRRLHSGRVVVKQPSQVTSDRYQFLDLASAEPNLGTADNNSVLTTDTAGQRIWTANLNLVNADVSANLSAERIYSDNIFFANGQPYISDVRDSNIYNGTATATDSLTLIDTLAVADLRSVKWTLSAKDVANSRYKSSTIDALTDGSSVYYNEYGVVLSSQYDVATFTTSIVSGNLNLYAVGDSNNTAITFQRTTLDSTTTAGFVPGAGYIQSVVGSGTATTCVVNNYTGNGVQTNYTLDAEPANENQTLVSVGGVLQPKTTYSVTGTTLTFSSAPVDGAPIEVTTFVTTTVTGYTGSRGYTGSAGALTNWTKKTTNYTAVSGDRIIADTSAGTFSITLPSSPTVGSYVQITDGANFHTTPLTVIPNGSTIEGQGLNVLVDTAAVDVQFVYDGTTWQIISTYGPAGYTGSAGPIGYTGSSGASDFLLTKTEFSGNASVSNGTRRFYCYTTSTIKTIQVYATVPPQGSATTVRINLNGSPVANVSLSSGSYYTKATNLNIVTVLDDYITIDVTEVGSSDPGSDLTVQLVART